MKLIRITIVVTTAGQLTSRLAPPAPAGRRHVQQEVVFVRTVSG